MRQHGVRACIIHPLRCTADGFGVAASYLELPLRFYEEGFQNIARPESSQNATKLFTPTPLSKRKVFAGLASLPGSMFLHEVQHMRQTFYQAGCIDLYSLYLAQLFF
ncbi:hypothetical protein NDU88_005307 [Pleurodeles waltl]|uniref:Uncharacterized protein n=1 Tax=Pleurodeles waltl TaxID=8319 RepID=A0AAV7PFB1_PLEWA|nr:hypothetical protein NDU88_005307 [Pleurodeles waltl]